MESDQLSKFLQLLKASVQWNPFCLPDREQQSCPFFQPAIFMTDDPNETVWLNQLKLYFKPEKPESYM